MKHLKRSRTTEIYPYIKFIEDKNIYFVLDNYFIEYLISAHNTPSISSIGMIQSIDKFFEYKEYATLFFLTQTYFNTGEFHENLQKEIL